MEIPIRYRRSSSANISVTGTGETLAPAQNSTITFASDSGGAVTGQELSISAGAGATLSLTVGATTVSASAGDANLTIEGNATVTGSGNTIAADSADVTADGNSNTISTYGASPGSSSFIVISGIGDTVTSVSGITDVTFNNGSAGTVNGSGVGIGAAGENAIVLTGEDDVVTATGSGVALTFGAGGSGVVYGSGLNITANGGGAAVVAENNSVTLSAAGSGNTSLQANGTGDTLVAGTGTTTMADEGTQGVYEYGSGDGTATISNGTGTSSGPANTLAFGSGITDEQLWLTQSGNNLDIDVMGSSSQVTVANWFSSTTSQLKDITAGSDTLATAQVSQLVQAMATYSTNNPGFNPTTVAQAPNDTTLQAAIAAAWKA